MFGLGVRGAGGRGGPGGRAAGGALFRAVRGMENGSAGRGRPLFIFSLSGARAAAPPQHDTGTYVDSCHTRARPAAACATPMFALHTCLFVRHTSTTLRPCPHC
ncbi:hypothetical protein EVAR_88495_1 [Eumeta japonica]|uniref:Uncharacterized protein n=1 Tax=Eumeta variegata TaxID=151549 RepID=A0A4C1XW70_EUMVA|nr:hypothetical protein EVAR_88495_1 [Eumeta japonica]